MKDDKPLERIKSSLWSRRLSMAKLTAGAGARAAAHAMGGLWRSDAEQDASQRELLSKQIAELTQELGQLKGSLMKAGQMLAMVGEHFLPPEALSVLRSLQSESPPVNFRLIDDIITRELAPDALAELRIEPKPLGAASLGQVHKAQRISDGSFLALKVQYPGVAEAIESDIRTLRRMLSLTKMLPDKDAFDAVFAEVRDMLHREMDYSAEQQQTEFFRTALADDARYAVPQVVPRFCATHVLATTFQEGLQLPHPDVMQWSQERRDKLGLAALELYFKELFVWRRVQTDPHFGNYRVRPGGERDVLILLDFGAVREVSEHYVGAYKDMIRGVLKQDPTLTRRGGEALGFLRPTDSHERIEFFMQLCTLVVEPFMGDFYDWGKSDLPKRIFAVMPDARKKLGLRPPPAESVFLDRKLGGMFVFLSTLKVAINGRALLDEYLDQ